MDFLEGHIRFDHRPNGTRIRWGCRSWWRGHSRRLYPNEQRVGGGRLAVYSAEHRRQNSALLCPRSEHAAADFFKLLNAKLEVFVVSHRHDGLCGLMGLTIELA